MVRITPHFWSHKMTAPLVEILTIGNELLAGDVLDTNSHWLCRQLAGRGVRVSRMATLPDDMATIGEALLATLSRGPGLIVTCGGLGPTVDDLTVAAMRRRLVALWPRIRRPLRWYAISIQHFSPRRRHHA